MRSILRVSDIPPDELHLVPITGLRRLIRADHKRPRPPNNRAVRRKRDRLRRDKSRRADLLASEVGAAKGEGFVTDWQLPDDPRSGSRFRFDREDSNAEDRNVQHRGGEVFGDPDEEDSGEDLSPGDDLDALYVDLGGEG